MIFIMLTIFHFYNCLRYGSCNIAFKKDSISNIKFNSLFGSRTKYSHGEDTLFIVECLKNNLKLYASTKNIGSVWNLKSNWFEGYNEKYFFDKGTLFCAINKNMKNILCLQYLIRHKELLNQLKFKETYKQMKKEEKTYLKEGKK